MASDSDIQLTAFEPSLEQYIHDEVKQESTPSSAAATEKSESPSTIQRTDSGAEPDSGAEQGVEQISSDAAAPSGFATDEVTPQPDKAIDIKA